MCLCEVSQEGHSDCGWFVCLSYKGGFSNKWRKYGLMFP